MTDMNPEVEIIKNEIEGLKGVITRFETKLDSFVALQVQLSELRIDHSATKGGLERAFDSIDSLKYRQEATGRLLNRIIGGAIAATVFLGVIQWFLLREFQEYDSMKKDVTTVTRRIDRISDVLIGGKSKEPPIFYKEGN